MGKKEKMIEKSIMRTISKEESEKLLEASKEKGE